MRQHQYDVVITGGGIAGSAAAIMLARAGARVAVIERTARFTDRVRGEWLAPWGTAEARRLGLLPAFRRAGAHAVPWNVSRSGKPRQQATPDGDPPLTFSHPRLQEELLAAAWDAGATVIRPALVRAITPRDGGSPAAVVLHRQGRVERLRTLLVVGADGRSSLARRILGRPEQVHRSARLLAGVLLGDVAGPDNRSYYLIRPGGAGLAMLYPQGDGLARAYVFLPDANEADFRGPEGFEHFRRVSLDSGIPAEVLAGATQQGPLASFMADDSWVEQPYQDGLALVGDAAGISDPTWGMGIALALRDARALAEAWIGEGAAEPAGRRYADERDRYFQVIRTVENWQSDLLLSRGPLAEQRRQRAARQWSSDPGSFPDLNGIGPEVEIGEGVRARFFGEAHREEPAARLVTA